MTTPDTWKKSSQSGGGEGNACIEITHHHPHVAVRHSKDPERATLAFPASAFTAHLGTLEVPGKEQRPVHTPRTAGQPFTRRPRAQPPGTLAGARDNGRWPALQGGRPRRTKEKSWRSTRRAGTSRGYAPRPCCSSPRRRPRIPSTSSTWSRSRIRARCWSGRPS
ncbi:DUF397 domain-containing protein [Streptomyces sp. NPDC000348]|uniref:DUF397 domain-containing protein n=1 Tax=Streptomyces sp. NPDC000348 TaxID=3364538 RepID=UPI0036870800